MAARLGINGFGRMGRLALRAASVHREIKVVHVNELKGGPETAAHLLEFDSVHGRWRAPIAPEAHGLKINGDHIGYSGFEAPGEAPWDQAGVEIVLECSGKFLTPEALEPYFHRDVRKVVVAAPVKEGALNIVMGVNDKLYDPEQHHVVTAASCTTNSLAPVVKVIHKALGIRHGIITTIHDVTNTQTVVDLPHKDLRRARSALMSLVPTTTGSATAIGLIYPELQGKLNGIAVRVPLLNASLTDCVFEVAADHRGRGQPMLAGGCGGRAARHPGLRGTSTGVGGLPQRPAIRDRRWPFDHGRRRHASQNSGLVRQRWGYANRLVELATKVAASLPAAEPSAAAV